MKVVVSTSDWNEFAGEPKPEGSFGAFEAPYHNVMHGWIGTPKLFDFNQIPFTERPQNPFVGLALKLGLLGRGSRDLRKLARFQNYDRVERKLLKFYEESSTSGN